MFRIISATEPPPSIRQRCSVRPVRRKLVVSTCVIECFAAIAARACEDALAGMSRMTSVGTKRVSPTGGRLQPARSCCEVVDLPPPFDAGSGLSGRCAIGGWFGGSGGCGGGPGGPGSENGGLAMIHPITAITTPPTMYQITLLL